MNNAQRVVMGLTGATPNGTPTEAEHRPSPASRLPSWVIENRHRHTIVRTEEHAGWLPNGEELIVEDFRCPSCGRDMTQEALG